LTELELMSLREINARGTKVTQAGVDKLQQKLLKVKVGSMGRQ
jgi:hypothetical protein